MDSSKSTKNVSLSLPNDEKPTERTSAPLRNAVSSVKRSKEPVRLGRLSFKPIRLTELTQEILEAENEPLKEVATSEVSNEDECDGQKDVKGKIFDDLKNIFDGSLDLGVTRLETPAKGKTVPSSNTANVICNEIPTVVRKETIENFVTPSSIRPITEESGTLDRIKICFNFEDNGLLKTPVNPNLKSRMQTCRSSTKLSSTHRNTSGDGGFNDKQIDFQRPRVVTSKSESSNTILQENKKENASKIKNNKVQFSLPLAHFHDNLKEITVKNVNYVVVNQLGKGGSSVVYHCFELKSKSERAIKKVNLSNDMQAVGYVNEVKLLERLQKCDRIVKMYDYEVVHKEKVLYVILEKGEADLAKILKDLSNANKQLQMHMLIYYWMEMLYAVKQIHENGIIHSDLKPENFLRAEGGLKLIDFGIASCMQDDMTSVVRDVPVGSCNYISPEALTNDSSNNHNSPSFGKPKFKVSYKSDVWSLGCILYQLVYKKTPFQHIGHMWAKLSAIMDPNHQIDYPTADWVPTTIISTIKKCLLFNVKARPSVDELIEEYEKYFWIK